MLRKEERHPLDSSICPDRGHVEQTPESSAMLVQPEPRPKPREVLPLIGSIEDRMRRNSSRGNEKP